MIGSVTVPVNPSSTFPPSTKKMKRPSYCPPTVALSVMTAPGSGVNVTPSDPVVVAVTPSICVADDVSVSDVWNPCVATCERLPLVTLIFAHDTSSVALAVLVAASAAIGFVDDWSAIRAR